MKKHLLVIIVAVLFFFSPYIFKPQNLTERDNDLGRTYIPIFSFIKNTQVKANEIPLWRGEQMMGESLIANPISSLLYPVNVLFLIIPVNFASLIYYIIHIFLAGMFTYMLAKEFKFSEESSLGSAIFFAFNPKLLLHIASGHITMVAAIAYFPLIILSVKKVTNKFDINWSVICAVALTFMYLTHATIFYYTIIFITVYSAYLLFKQKNTHNIYLLTKKLIILTIIPIITFCLAAAAIMPQLEFAKISTRSQLTITEIAQPTWNHTKFLSSLIFPYVSFINLDAESFLYLGAVVIVFALIGLINLTKKTKIIIVIFLFFTLMYVLGTSTPFFNIFYDHVPGLKYSRITTRLWFGVALLFSILAANGFEKIKNKKLIYLVIGFFLMETCYIGYKKINSTPKLDFTNEALYQYLSSDKDLFRVYCTTYCFNPQQLTKYNIQLLNGETPIQQSQFINFLEQAGGYNPQKFSVIFPPYNAWLNPNPPKPNKVLLTEANVKYIASTYPLEIENFSYMDKFNNIYIYKNESFKKRISFFDSNDAIYTVSYKPNSISLAFPKSDVERNIIIAENYFPGWFAFIEGNKYKIDSYKEVFQKITIPPYADHIDIKYLPDSFLFGKTITLTTIVLLGLFFLKNRTKKV